MVFKSLDWMKNSSINLMKKLHIHGLIILSTILMMLYSKLKINLLKDNISDSLEVTGKRLYKILKIHQIRN